MLNENHHPNNFLYRNAHVLARLDDYNFLIDVPNASGQRMKVAVTACKDFMPTSEIQAGVVLTWIGYEEDRVHHCFELDNNDNGYGLERDNHGIPVHHTFTPDAGSRSRTARSDETETAQSE